MTHLDKVPGYPEYRTSPKSPVYPIVQFVSTDKNGLKPIQYFGTTAMGSSLNESGKFLLRLL